MRKFIDTIPTDFEGSDVEVEGYNTIVELHNPQPRAGSDLVEGAGHPAPGGVPQYVHLRPSGSKQRFH